MLGLGKNTDSGRLEREAWLKIRQRGRWRFILTGGVAFGAMFIVTSTMALFRRDVPLAWFLPLSALIWFGAGYLHGARKWNKYESKYGPALLQN